MSAPTPGQNSFIPKRGPVRRVKRTVSRQIYLFTIISYVLVFTALVASAAVYGFNYYVERQYSTVVSELNEAVATFSETDFQRIARLESRLVQTEAIIENQVSFAALLEILETNLSPLVSVTNLEITRSAAADSGQPRYQVAATFAADSLDVTMFQRDYATILAELEEFMVDTLDLTLAEADIGLSSNGEPIVTQTNSDDEEVPVGFTARFFVSAEYIPVVADRFVAAVQSVGVHKRRSAYQSQLNRLTQ